MPVVSTHEHHLKDEDHKGLTLEGIFNHSYVGWQNIPLGENKKEHKRFLDQARYNSYFVWLEKALKRLYRFGDRITVELWEDLSAQIQRRHNDPDFHVKILHWRKKSMKGILI